MNHNALLIASTEAARNEERLADWLAKDGPQRAKAEREYRRDSALRKVIDANPLYYERLLKRLLALERGARETV